MKKKVLLTILGLVLLLSLAITPAVPAMAANAEITLTMSADPVEVCDGGSVDITIILTNTGTYYDVHEITVSAGAPLNVALPSQGDGVLETGEVWTWILTTTVTQETTFSASALAVIIPCGETRSACAETTVTVVPCGGGEGLTPGYWKNHLEDWPPTGYSPNDYFDVIFGAGPHVTLLKALKTGGGGVKALGRHATAALLNAAHPNIDYDLSIAQIIAMVQNAYNVSGDYEGVKDIFEGYNEQEGDIDS